MNDQRSALIVDDERDIRELLVLTLGRMGLRTETAASLNEARASLAAHRFDLCLTDMRLPDGSGIDLIAEISAQYPHTPVAMITAFGNIEAAVEALKAGAFDFVSKPVDLSVLRGLVKHALDLPQKGARRPAGSAPASDALATRLYGDSPAIVALKQTLGKVARSQAPVYIAGESGTGKELVARTIHEQGARATGPFVPVNCGAIPAELMESEFFGHKKGSFTGAHVDKPGLFQAADGGTLFLDEVAELPLPMQVKLLRAIQEKCIRPVGANIEVPVDVRILSATHKDLAGAGRRRALPPRPVLPHQRHRVARAAAARTPRRSSRPVRRDPAAPVGPAGPCAARADARSGRRAARLSVPRQRARTGEHPRTRARARRRRPHRSQRPAPARLWPGAVDAIAAAPSTPHARTPRDRWRATRATPTRATA